MNKPTKLTDAEILNCLSGGPDRQCYGTAFQQLFEDQDLRNMVFSQVLKNKGSEEDAWEVFQECLVQFERSVRENRFEQKSKVSTYFVATAKWHWINTQRKRNRDVEWRPEQHEQAVIEQVRNYSDEALKILDLAIESIGSNCKEVLYYWARSFTPDELCEVMDFSSGKMAKKGTYRYREKLKEFFNNNPEYRKRMKGS